MPFSSVVWGGCYFGVQECWEMFETAEGLLGEKKGRMERKAHFFHTMLQKENSGFRLGLTEEKQT